MSRPVAVDVFCGAGGLSLGLEQAGFDVAVAIEIDPVHAAVHKFNFPDCALIPRSVIGLTGSDITKSAGLVGRTIELVVGGPPCQGFSMIGQRALDDPRNSLVREFVRIVRELDAPYFLFENVKGLTLGNHRRFLDEIVQEFHSCGYETNTPTVLNAVNYGVPQERERLFLMGAKRGLRLPSFPERRTRAAGGTEDMLGLPEGPTCEDALGDLPDADRYDELINSDSVEVADWPKRKSKYAQELHVDTRGAWHDGIVRRWAPFTLTSSMRTHHTAISKRRFNDTVPGAVEPISRFFRLNATGVSNTLRAGTDSARGAFTSPRPIHYSLARCITVREMARLHGFPDWFRLHRTKWHGARQIGNAVAPPMARVLGLAYLKAMGKKQGVEKSMTDLGDETLVAMDMSQAAKYWNVTVPIGRRDRKSGARKRKQEEIEAQSQSGREA